MTRLQLLTNYQSLRDTELVEWGLDDTGQMLEDLLWHSLGLASGPEEPDSDDILRQAIAVEEAKR